MAGAGDPSLWRVGELQLWVKTFCPQSREEPVAGQGPWAFCKLRDDGMVPLICPTCQNVFAGLAQSIHAATTVLLCMGLFSIFVLEARVASALAVSGCATRSPFRGNSLRKFQSVYAFAALKLRRTPRFALQAPRGCATRSPKGEAWWARQDSNLQPDRYERRGRPGKPREH